MWHGKGNGKVEKGVEKGRVESALLAIQAGVLTLDQAINVFKLAESEQKLLVEAINS